MSSSANPYCHALGIQVPRLERAKRSPDANYYSLLIVALLERGEPTRWEIPTYMGEDITRSKPKLADYDVLAAVDVRALLRALRFEPGERRLAELGPPQKTRQLNERARTLKITTTLLVRGSCGISRPFGDEKALHTYLREGESTKLRRRLEADARSLYALYQYGRLHGAVRLRWGFLDERLPAPWVHRDEHTLYHLMKRAYEIPAPLEVVVGSAPSWADPWSRVRRAYVEQDEGGWRFWLVDEQGYVIDEADVQAALRNTFAASWREISKDRPRRSIPRSSSISGTPEGRTSPGPRTPWSRKRCTPGAARHGPRPEPVRRQVDLVCGRGRGRCEQWPRSGVARSGRSAGHHRPRARGDLGIAAPPPAPRGR